MKQDVYLDMRKELTLSAENLGLWDCFTFYQDDDPKHTAHKKEVFVGEAAKFSSSLCDKGLGLLLLGSQSLREGRKTRIPCHTRRAACGRMRCQRNWMAMTEPAIIFLDVPGRHVTRDVTAPPTRLCSGSASHQTPILCLVSRAVVSSAGMQGRGKWEIPDKTRRPATSASSFSSRKEKRILTKETGSDSCLDVTPLLGKRIELHIVQPATSTLHCSDARSRRFSSRWSFPTLLVALLARLFNSWHFITPGSCRWPQPSAVVMSVGCHGGRGRRATNGALTSSAVNERRWASWRQLAELMGSGAALNGGPHDRRRPWERRLPQGRRVGQRCRQSICIHELCLSPIVIRRFRPTGAAWTGTYSRLEMGVGKIPRKSVPVLNGLCVCRVSGMADIRKNHTYGRTRHGAMNAHWACKDPTRITIPLKIDVTTLASLATHCGLASGPCTARVLRQLASNIKILLVPSGYRGGVVVRLLTCHLGEPCLYPSPEGGGGSLFLVFTCGNRAGRCRWPAGFFSRGSPVSPALAFRRCFISTLLTSFSSALKSSMLRATHLRIIRKIPRFALYDLFQKRPIVVSTIDQNTADCHAIVTLVRR
ncbi:hypothetical protein PR048_004556 [Dryococelus australis]|uniref:Uncharacterized protein n=1 Tax=Dryococelus australis TaxID=614101 RepID=A0ABQ9I5S5_9NEOP|nr:hypothetical protein PR048_004556 [Dryococelus australis]